MTMDHDASDEQSYGLVLAFDSDSEDFVRGFEAGQLWERLTRDGWLHQPLAHASNAEMFIRMAEARGLPFRAEDIEGTDEWIAITIGTPVDQEAS